MNRSPAHTRLCRQIVAAIRKRGGWAERIHASPYQSSGLPDVVGCIRSRFVSFEVKTGQAVPTDLQLFTAAKIGDAGGIAKIVYSLDQALTQINRLEHDK